MAEINEILGVGEVVTPEIKTIDTVEIDSPMVMDETALDIIPVWKDTYYTTEDDELQYTICLDDEPIFRGKAYKAPNDDELRINVSKICSNYLGVDLAELWEGARDGGSFTDDYSILGNIKTFKIKDGDGNVLGSYRFIHDWSYERNAEITSDRCAVINGHYAEGMYTLESTLEEGDFTLNNGNPKYKTLVCGPRYVLYYENAYGGFDSYLIEGKVIKKDTVTSHTYTKSNVNTSAKHEMKRYIDEIQGTYELHSGYMRDDESERLAKHLMTSNQVYMHDLKTDDIYPVVITNKDVEVYNYANNKMYNYTINVTVSQNRIRK